MLPKRLIGVATIFISNAITFQRFKLTKRIQRQPPPKNYVFTLIPEKLESLLPAIHACVENDPKCQKTIYENYFGYCLKIVFRYVYRYDEAVDVVNDGFLKVFRNIHKFIIHDHENIEKLLMGWMRTIMINSAIDYLRKNSFLPEIGSLSTDTWFIEDRSEPSDKDVLYKELILKIKQLSPAYRSVFNLYVIDGYTHQEIADQLGISVGASKSNLSKARTILQRRIKNHERGIAYATSQ